MRVFALLAILAVGCWANILPDYSLPNDLIQLMGVREKPQNAAISQCVDIQFNYCQGRFNEFFGLPDSTSWRNGTLIYNTVQTYLEKSVPELVKVCNARTQFYQCLGSSYYPCINLYTLLNKQNPDFQQAFDYVRTFRGLEWMCVGGFTAVTGNWGCLGTFPTTAAYQNCINKFSTSVSASNFCPAVQETGDCLGTEYTNHCGVGGNGYFGCENFLITFDNACWGLRCAAGV